MRANDVPIFNAWLIVFYTEDLHVERYHFNKAIKMSIHCFVIMITLLTSYSMSHNLKKKIQFYSISI